MDTDRLGAQRQDPLMIALYGLAGETGSVHTLYKKRLRDGDQFTGFREKVKEELGDILWYLTALANIEGLSLSDIAIHNLEETTSRWLPTGEDDWVDFDEHFPPGEQLPRLFMAQFVATVEEGISKVEVFVDGERCGAIGRYIPPQARVKRAAAKKAVHSGRFRPTRPSAAEKKRVAYKAIRSARIGEISEQKTSWINKLISQFFDEIRIIICKKNAGRVGEATTISGVAAMILKYFAITAAGAHAIATAIIYTIYAAAKNAFCKITAPDAKALILGAGSKVKKATKPKPPSYKAR